MNCSDSSKIYKYYTLGALAGILVIAILIVGATAWFKASKADSDEQRANELKKIKWLAGFIIFVVIASSNKWSNNGYITKCMKG
nr:hypothetical protein [Mycoplasmopsis bovis]